MSETTLSGNRPESSLQVWAQLLDSLRRSGFREAGPEYLKLSKLVAETRRHQLLRAGNDKDEPAWLRLCETGAEAHALLAPLAEAARILAELPRRASIKAEVASARSPAPADADAAPTEPSAQAVSPPPPSEPIPRASAKKASKRKTKAKVPGKHTNPSKHTSKEK